MQEERYAICHPNGQLLGTVWATDSQEAERIWRDTTRLFSQCTPPPDIHAVRYPAH